MAFYPIVFGEWDEGRSRDHDTGDHESQNRKINENSQKNEDGPKTNRRLRHEGSDLSKGCV